MKWRGRRGSANIEDRRGAGPAFGGRRMRMPMGGRGMRGMPLPRGRAGLIVLVILILFSVFTGSNLLDGGGTMTGGAPPSARDDQAAGFVSVVLADTEEVWSSVFADAFDRDYDEPTLVLFSGAVSSACGGASSAVGPFYCPGDERVYLDTGFFDQLARELGAGGDFAAAYVIAHEVGHHVQQELGILGEAQAAKQGLSRAEANAIQVRVELQADCFAGVWAARAQEMFASLEPGDVDEAMNAASRIGDDALQRRGGGPVRPDSFQHGTSEQRRAWFQRGWKAGDPAACDTFAADRL